MLFLLLFCCIAPVSWRHAYVLSAPAIVVLFNQGMDRRISYSHLFLIAVFVLSISSFGFDGLALFTGMFVLVIAAMLPPSLGVLVVFAGADKMHIADKCIVSRKAVQ